jgi:two-component system, NarL family, sensor histidine kinase DesK
VDHLYAHGGEGVSGTELRTDPELNAYRERAERLRKSAGEVALFGDRRKRGGRFFDYIWLVYSLFFLIDPIQRHTRAAWVGFGIAYAVFLGCYFGIVFSRTQRWKIGFLAGMALLGVMYFRFNAGAGGMFIYTAALAPFVIESIGLGIGAVLLSAALSVGEGTYLHYSPWTWGIFAAFCVTVGAANVAAAQRMRAGRRLGLAYEEIAHLVKVAERERIARDLHDVLGHTLSVVVLKSELAGKVIEGDPERARREIGEVEQIARKALSEVREAITGYRADGLAAEIARAQKALDAAGVQLEVTGQPPQLEAAAETVLSLIVREAVTNIVRHAQARHCWLSVKSRDEGTALIVEDDGRGGIREEGNGLRGMRERAESLGGRLRIESGAGTRLLVEIPAQAAAGR